MPGRPERIGDQIRAELSTLLLRSVRDPALRLITLTHVQVSRDLRHARVYYTAPLDASAIETKRGLRRAGPFLRSQLGRRVRLRHVPELTFVHDDSFEREQRIAQVLEEIHMSTPATQDSAELDDADQGSAEDNADQDDADQDDADQDDADQDDADQDDDDDGNPTD